MVNVMIQIDRLISETSNLHLPDGHNDNSSLAQSSKACALIASIKNLLGIIFGNEKNAYIGQIVLQEDKLSLKYYNAYMYIQVCTEVLKALRNDIDHGLIGTIENKVTAQNFDDFLAHAELYISQDKKMEAGVIASVVFEDTVKKICTKVGIVDTSKLDNCISALSREHISKARAASCRAAAAVRNSATHANWNEFDIPEVQNTINVTRELMEQFLESN